MAKKYLDYDGLLYFWQKIKNLFVTDVTYTSSSRKIQKTKAGTTSDVVTLSKVATSNSYTDLDNKPTIPTGVEPTTTTPKMDGTASVGSETKFARGDHVHPSDTSRVPTTRKVNGHALSADVTVTASDVGLGNVVDGANVLITTAAGDEMAMSYTLDGTTYDTSIYSANAITGYMESFSTLLGNKVDKVDGKGLSTNDFTDADKTKLDGIDDFVGATTSTAGTHGLVPAPPRPETMLIGNGEWGYLQVCDSSGNSIRRSLWVELDGDDWQYRINLDDVNSFNSGLMPPEYKSKLDGIEAGAEVNVNADWSATSGDAQILNKPTLGTASAKGVVTSISSDSADLPTVTAVKNYVETAITGSASFQGTAPTTFAPTNYKSGYYWVVGTAGTYVGQTCEAGDMIFAIADYGTAYSASDFDVVQTNLDITNITNAEIDTIVAS